ncbi:MAG: Asp-tRNA(Asn)/Glu-tRNA(Gln) amidotransferase subunit GatB [Planctomycetota bacterium]
MKYEAVIGLETHAELLTESKLWCGCSTEFGQPANTQTCPVCLGMPGVLPVLNERALDLSIRAALAMNCRVNRRTYFDRKNYYYPDLPKNYQISQNYANLGEEGHVTVSTGDGDRQVGIWNVHLEEDAGKNVHPDDPGADYSLVDLNRAGTPLLEIVSAPDIRSVEEAECFMKTLRQILLYTKVSDCRMQEGSLRFEASISLRQKGSQQLGGRVEIKNLNSMKAVTNCLSYEIDRQKRVLDRGDTVKRETRLWDQERNKSARMRSKEEAQDYRYFPEPDLVEYRITDERLNEIRSRLPELPADRRRRFVEELGLSEYEAQVLTEDRDLADYFESVIGEYDAPGSAANWLMNDILGILNDRQIGIAEFDVAPGELAELIRLEQEGRITANGAREVLPEMMETGRDATSLVEELGLEAISGDDELDPVIQQAMEEAPQAVEDYLGGKQEAIGALVGQIMRLTQGQADPKKAKEMLEDKLSEMDE